MAIVSKDDFTGTASDDILVGLARRRARSDIHAGGGSDLIFADHAPIYIDQDDANATRQSAISLDDPKKWAVGSNPLVADDSIPYATIVSQGATDQDFYSLTLAAGEMVTLDVDFGATYFGGQGLYTSLVLLDASGKVVARGTDRGDEAEGFYVNDDAFLKYTVDAAGTYFIRVDVEHGIIGGEGPPKYVLSVSATDHVAEAVVRATGDIVYADGGYSNAIVGGDGDDRINGSTGDDYVTGGDGDDVVFGNDGDDAIWADAGDDRLDGGAGTYDSVIFRDSAVGVTADLRIRGAQDTGLGHDILRGFENLSGSAFDDHLTGDAGNNRLDGEAGNDTLIGGDGDDSITPGAGGGFADGGAGTDYLRLGDDTKLAWTADLIAGTAQSANGDSHQFVNFETVAFGAGDDTATIGVTGGRAIMDDGDDVVFVVGSGSASGGDGYDTLDLSSATTTGDRPLVIKLYNNFTYSSFESVVSTGDVALNIKGSKPDNLLSGGSGDDILDGGKGEDQLFGNGGDDFLTGTTLDVLSGGSGSDQFLTYGGRIVDFSQVEHDKMYVARLAGYDFIGTENFSGDKQIRFAFDGNDTVVSYKSGNYQYELARLTGDIELTEGDFAGLSAIPPHRIADLPPLQHGHDWLTHLP